MTWQSVSRAIDTLIVGPSLPEWLPRVIESKSLSIVRTRDFVRKDAFGASREIARATFPWLFFVSNVSSTAIYDFAPICSSKQDLGKIQESKCSHLDILTFHHEINILIIDRNNYENCTRLYRSRISNIGIVEDLSQDIIRVLAE